MAVPERLFGNLGAFTEDEIRAISQKSACIVGCGGLGGYVINCLARFGIGSLTLIDGDVFSQSNLNRQLFATAETLGKNKAIVSCNAAKQINADIEVKAHPVMLSPDNATALIKNHDIVIDCLDNIQSRRLLADACDHLKIPLVHGAISGLYGQVAVRFPGSKLFDILYPTDNADSMGNPVFTPQLVASIQSCEAVKILLGRGCALDEKVLYIDLLNCEFLLVDLH